MAVTSPRVVLPRIPAIERMRERSAAMTKVTVATVRSVVDDLTASTPLSTTASRLGMEESEVLDIVADLGTWLTHVHGKASDPAPAVVAKDKTGQLSLFDEVPAGVVVPAAYSKWGEKRRDVSKAFLAIVRRQPDDSEIQRWIDRKYPNAVGVLSGRDVFTVWRIAQLGRLGEIDLVSSAPAFAQVTVAAYDLLDVSLSDAITGMVQMFKMTKVDFAEMDLDVLENAITKVAWLGESRVRKISKLLAAAKESGDVWAADSLQRDIKAFMQEVKANPFWRPSKVSMIGEGQILRLLDRAGLGIPEDARKTESEIRRKLVDMGLRKDIDRLLPDAMRAVAAKAEDAFWSSIQSRLLGDPDWRVELEEALAEHASA